MDEGQASFAQNPLGFYIPTLCSTHIFLKGWKEFFSQKEPIFFIHIRVEFVQMSPAKGMVNFLLKQITT